jgi:hypothetical protein
MSGPDSAPEPGRDAGQQASVFGNLPRSRPSVRSPRRAAPKPAGSDQGEHAGSTPAGAAAPGSECALRAAPRRRCETQ